MSWSWGWVYKGFVSRWYLLKGFYGSKALRFWLRHLDGDIIQNRSFVLYPDGAFKRILDVGLAEAAYEKI